MPEISESNDVVTQITTVKVPSKHQSEVIALMEERARFMATQPGFVSVSLHRSEDGNHVVNYVQWRNRELLAAARRPRIADWWERIQARPAFQQAFAFKNPDASDPVKR